MKRLLNEDITRRMMKLANIPSLSDNFISNSNEELQEGMGGVAPPAFGRDDDELEEGVNDLDEELEEGVYGRDDELEEKMDMGPEAEDAEEDADLGDLGAGAEGDADVDVLGLVSAIADAIEAHTGVNIDVAGDGEGDAMDAPPMDDEPAMDEPAMDEMDEVTEDVMEEDPAAALEEADINLEEEMTEEDLVNEVTRRVAARLLKATESK